MDNRTFRPITIPEFNDASWIASTSGLYKITPVLHLFARSHVYAGIGSRKTPPDILNIMEEIGHALAKAGLILRSGGAPGADVAFETGCDRGAGGKEIFLPWKRFNRNHSDLHSPPPRAFEMAMEIHRYLKFCKPSIRNFHARNCQQVLGENLDTPADFILYWAPEKGGTVQGGTATAVSLARTKGIPTFNLSSVEVRTLLEVVLRLDWRGGQPLHKVCTWCQEIIEESTCGTASHGICPSCASKLMIES